MLGNYGGDDKGPAPDQVKAFEAAMKKAGKSVDVKIYEGAGHAFANVNNPWGGYREAAAKDAWARTTRVPREAPEEAETAPSRRLGSGGHGAAASAGLLVRRAGSTAAGSCSGGRPGAGRSSGSPRGGPGCRRDRAAAPSCRAALFSMKARACSSFCASIDAPAHVAGNGEVGELGLDLFGRRAPSPARAA